MKNNYIQNYKPIYWTGANSQALEHWSNEVAKNEQRKYNFVIKLIIVDIAALFELYLAIS